MRPPANGGARAQPALPDLPWPQLWQGRSRFTVLHTGGSPQALAELLQVWGQWQAGPVRDRQLHLVLLCEDATEAQAAFSTALQARGPHASPADRQRLSLLQACWPPLTPNLHPLDLQPGQVQLLLHLGPLQQVLPRLCLQADLLWLHALPAVAPPQRLRVLKALARLCAVDGLACGVPAEPGMLADLRTAGFHSEPEGPAKVVWARHRPHRPHRQPPPAVAAGPSGSPAPQPAAPTALVIGAGLAGAAVAQALARQGLSVTVLDRRAEPASEASGNPAALFHGTVNPDDGPYARLFRAAALVAQREYTNACQTSTRPAAVPGAVNGLLRLHGQTPEDQALAQMTQQLQHLALPAGYVQAVDAAQASRLAGCPLPGAAWYFPGGGWVDPAAWVGQALQTPGVRFRGRNAVQTIRRQAQDWQALDAEGRVLAQAPVLVLTCAVSSLALLPLQAKALHWPLRQTRGQVTQLQVKPWPTTPQPSALAGQAAGAGLQRAVAGDGYALPLPAAGAVLCGATRHAETLSDRPGPYPTLRQTVAINRAAGPGPDCDPLAGPQADHQHNLQRLQRLTALQPAPGSELQGRVSWRLHTDDRLPMAGPVPEWALGAGGAGSCAQPVRQDLARRWPRVPGLFVLTALGARGATLAPLLGRLVAAQATGAPWPLEQDLADAVDPVRWALRAARAAQARAAD